MKKYFQYVLLGVVIGCSCMKTFGQEKDVPKDLYLSSTIPDSLKDNANSVVRYSNIDFDLKGPGQAVEKIHSIVTILNEKADDEAILKVGYNKKFLSLGRMEMIIYDANGNVIKKYHKGDAYDGAELEDMTLVSDDRFLGLKHSVAAYPTTVEIFLERDLNSLMNLGGWEYQGNEQSVQNSYYHVSIDSTAGFRYLNKNTAIKPVRVADGARYRYSWSVSNMKPIKLEEGAEGWRVFPHIYFSSNAFVFYGMPGDFSSWKSYGKWQLQLNNDVHSLTVEREAEIRKMTDSIKTDKEKAKFLYNYLQKNMRYVNIVLGIGGLKPLAATFVDQKKYGDCKALSNYMFALLNAVGIESHYALVNCFANQEPADPKFPYDMFNHVILCVPLKGDTTWLECTSNTQPFGKLGSFSENRRALLITDDGGKLVNTPKSIPEDNQFNSDVQLTLDADGGAKAKIKVSATGTYRNEFLKFSAYKWDEEKEQIMNWLNLKQPNSFDVKPASDANGQKEVDMSLEYDKFCDIAVGDKQFYRPHVFDLVAFTVPVEEHRKSDYYFETPMEKTCVTTIDLPAGFEIETLPANQTFKFAYGNYDVKYTYDAPKNEVIANAKFYITNQVIPAAKYTELQDFLNAVAKAQNKKLVIKRKA